MTAINLVNKFGHFQYNSAINIDDLDVEKIWTIKDPTQDQLDVGLEVRKYDGIKYILSKGASKVLPAGDGKYSGCACVIHTPHSVILVGGYDQYLQHVQTAKLAGDTPIETIAREVKDVLAIDADPSRFIEIGKYTFPYRVGLLNQTFDMLTIVFSLQLKSDDLNFIDFNSVQYFATFRNGITYIMNLPIANIPDFPDEMMENKFNGYNRRIIEMFFGLPTSKFSGMSRLKELHIRKKE